MAIICPTVTATSPEEYKVQMERVSHFTERLHIDFSDGKFSPVKLINPIQSWWPKGELVDFHIMYEKPLNELETLMSLHPHMIIIHAESKGDLPGIVDELHAVGIRVGIALLQKTKPKQAKRLIENADHALIFSGDLGHFGGVADEKLLAKVGEIQNIHPHVEIGWDGGINADNAKRLMLAGVDVLNVGGSIHKAENPQNAYDILNQSIQKG